MCTQLCLFKSCFPDDNLWKDDTNVLGVFNTAQTAAKHWIATGFKEGSVVIVSSMSSQIYNMAEGICKPLTHVSMPKVHTWTSMSYRGSPFLGLLQLFQSRCLISGQSIGCRVGSVSHLFSGFPFSWTFDISYNIRVNILSPGYVSTEQSGVHPKAVREFQASSVPLGRVSHTRLQNIDCWEMFFLRIKYCEPSEQTAQVLLLLSHQYSSYTTGSEVFVDGAYSLLLYFSIRTQSLIIILGGYLIY